MVRKPSLRLHKSGNYFVHLNGRDQYLGKNREGAEAEYHRIMSEYYQRRNSLQIRVQQVRSRVSLSMDELVIQYLESIRDRYEPTNSFTDYKKAGELLNKLYGKMAVSSFVIPCFQHVIREMLKEGKSKRTINHRIDAIKKMFQYALDCDIITAEQYFKIKSVPRIRRDDIRVKPERVVPPVEVDVVQRTLPYFSPMVADMVTVQLHSGMRAGELCRLNWAEIDRSGTVWMYRPEKHKTANKGKKRAIPLGPVCRAVLERYESSAAAGGFVFNPQDIERRASAVRKPRTTNRTDHYNSDRYTKEIRCGVDAAIRAGAITTGERWASHQLRHRAGTDARAKFGIDAAQLLLGHSDVRTSERYALPDESKVLEFAEMLG